MESFARVNIKRVKQLEIDNNILNTPSRYDRMGQCQSLKFITKVKFHKKIVGSVRIGSKDRIIENCLVEKMNSQYKAMNI